LKSRRSSAGEVSSGNHKQDQSLSRSLSDISLPLLDTGDKSHGWQQQKEKE